jgi:hypothetical protein
MIPNAASAELCAHLPRRQQSMAIIGGYATRNIQNVTVIQSHANEIVEGTTNMAFALGHLHITPLLTAVKYHF